MEQMWKLLAAWFTLLASLTLLLLGIVKGVKAMPDSRKRNNLPKPGQAISG